MDANCPSTSFTTVSWAGRERGSSGRERERARRPIYRERGGRERAWEREETVGINSINDIHGERN
jgi:hypothetical protein